MTAVRVICVFWCVLAIPAWARETDLGNGGSLIRLDNGEVDLADSYVNAESYPETEMAGVPMTLGLEIREELTSIRRMLEAYGIRSSHFWDSHVFGDRVDYRYADTLPCKDYLHLKDKKLDEARAIYSCTLGWTTLIERASFESFKDPRKQALAIVHERLHAFYGAVPDSHRWIAPFIGAVNGMRRLQEAQLAGDRGVLSTDQIRQMESLFGIAKKLGFEIDERSRARVGSGGGLIAEFRVELTGSFVGVGGRVLGTAADATYPTRIDSSVILGNSVVEVAFVADSFVLDSSISFSDVREMKIAGGRLDSVTAKNSLIEECSLENVVLSKSRCLRSDVVMSRVEGSEISGGTSSRTLVSGYEVKDSRISGSVVRNQRDTLPAERHFVASSVIEESLLSKVDATASEIVGSSVHDSTTDEASMVRCSLRNARVGKGSRCVDSRIASLALSKRVEVFIGKGAKIMSSVVDVGGSDSSKIHFLENTELKGLDLSVWVSPIELVFDGPGPMDFSGSGRLRYNPVPAPATLLVRRPEDLLRAALRVEAGASSSFENSTQLAAKP